jgi:hypothetical protein
MLRPLRLAPLALAALLLAGCDGAGNTTTITIDAQSDGDGNALITADKDGKVALKSEGFEGSLKLPKIAVTADDLDLDGITLYPGSQVRDIHVESRKRGGNEQGEVRLAFESPAPLPQVQAWFRDALAKNGAKAQAKGDGFAGTTKDGDPFTLTLVAGEGKTSGGMTLRSE